MTEVDLIKKYLLPNSVRIPLIKEIIERAVRTVRYTVIFSVPLKYAYTHSYTRQEHAPYTTHTLSPALCHVHPNVTQSIHPSYAYFCLRFDLRFDLLFDLLFNLSVYLNLSGRPSVCLSVCLSASASPSLSSILSYSYS
jgi:hypothetical protein